MVFNYTSFLKNLNRPLFEDRQPIPGIGLNRVQLAELAQAYIEKYGPTAKFTNKEIVTHIRYYMLHQALYRLRKLGVCWFEELPPLWDIEKMAAMYSHDKVRNLLLTCNIPDLEKKAAEIEVYRTLTCAELKILTQDVPDPGK